MTRRLNVPRLVIGGTASGIGKTTFTVGLAGALRRRGLRVAVFKCGPDYLDPTYHARAAGVASHNLDGWMMGRDGVLATFAHASRGADIALIEGVMGLFDGASPSGEEGSTAEIAKWLSAPVLLALDASGIARTVAAIARGFAAFDPGVRIAGLICNRLGGRGHLELLRRAMGGGRQDLPVMGGMPLDPARAFPERHLGLLRADERTVPDDLIAAWSEAVEQWCDLDAIMAAARAAEPLMIAAGDEVEPPSGRCRIGLAYDAAFHFYYEDNLRRLSELGAELVRFSPMSDPHLPPVDGIYIGGGYPEAHADALAANGSMREEIARFSESGGVIYAECGGLMYLCSAIRALDGSAYPMAGVIPAQAVMCRQLRALGYTEVVTVLDSPLGPAGTRLRGHQFRYSELQPAPLGLRYAYETRRRSGGEAAQEGYLSANTLASYIHLHWAGTPEVPRALVAACTREAGA